MRTATLSRSLQRREQTTKAVELLHQRGVYIGASERPGKDEMSFTEFLCAIGAPDAKGSSRLQLAAGSDEHGVYSEAYGGFFAPPRLAKRMFERAMNTGELLPLAERFPADPQSNGTEVPTWDETSRADGSRFGGVRAYWRKETQTVTPTRARFELLSLKKNQLMALAYATNELLRSPMADAVLERSFALEISFKAEDAMINGATGGMVGVMQSDALITVAKETDQPSDTLVAANFRKMWRRLWAPSRKNAVWIVNQDVDDMLLGIDWSNCPNVYKPAGVDYPGYASLFGRPVIPAEYAQTLGNKGDVLVFDPTQYAVLDVGDMQKKMSAEARALEFETVFMFILEINGMPGWRVPTTPKNSATTVSPYVTLEARN